MPFSKFLNSIHRMKNLIAKTFMYLWRCYRHPLRRRAFRMVHYFFLLSKCCHFSFAFLVGFSASFGMIQIRLIISAPLIRPSLQRIWTCRGVTFHFSAASCTDMYPFISIIPTFTSSKMTNHNYDLFEILLSKCYH